MDGTGECDIRRDTEKYGVKGKFKCEGRTGVVTCDGID
jgi:hypothetical protein